MPGFRCDTCAISVNSQQQYAQHLTGKAHLKRLKTKELASGTWDPSKLIASSPKLYGSFVPASSTVQSENSTTNQQLPPPPPPSIQQQESTPTLAQQQQQQYYQTLQQQQQQQSPPPPPPPPPPHEPPASSKPVVNPVVQAVVDNALGVLPTKRKMYDGECSVCKIVFNSPSQELQHYQGGKHAKKVKLSTFKDDQNTPIKQVSTFSCQYCNVTVNSLQQFEAHRMGTKHKAIFDRYKNGQMNITTTQQQVVTSG